MDKSAFDEWAEMYRKFAAEGSELMWPSETLVRLFKGAYVPGLDRNFQGKRVVDIGFGNGNNLIFLGALGLLLSGTEVSQELCVDVSAKLRKLGYASDLRFGTNRSIPFENGSFDFLVSWNVLHYEKNESDIREALSEYRRVLKSRGRFFLSTTGPDHKILRKAGTLGMHRYQINRDDDFRKGQTFFYFDSANYLDYYFSDFFVDILIGRTHDQLFTETLDWFIVTGIKE
jgi:SAM-dependent methyltransferase